MRKKPKDLEKQALQKVFKKKQAWEDSEDKKKKCRPEEVINLSRMPYGLRLLYIEIHKIKSSMIQRYDALSQDLQCLGERLDCINETITRQGEKIMGELFDKFAEVKQAIVDERQEVITAIQELIDAGSGGEKITVAMLQELKDEVQGIHQKTEIPPPPPENV